MDESGSIGLPPRRFAEIDAIPLLTLLSRLNYPAQRDARLQARSCYRVAHQCLKWARAAKERHHYVLARRRLELARLFWRAARLWRVKAQH
jgi:hypothetical protein